MTDLPVDLSVDNAAAVLDAFVDITRGEGGELVDGTIVLETIRGVHVHAYPGPEGWWEARLEISVYVGTDHEDVAFRAPLKQGPVWYADSDTTMQDVVDWLREVTDCKPDIDSDEEH